MKIRNALANDASALLHLYREVAKNDRGIARSYEEITPKLIENNLRLNEEKGIVLVGVDEESNELVAEIHAGPYGITIFDHILTHLTLVVHPDFQGKGLGKKLFQALLNEVLDNRPDILRIELEARASNRSAIGLYQSLGFVKEGVLRNKTRNNDGSFEDSLQMAWLRP